MRPGMRLGMAEAIAGVVFLTPSSMSSWNAVVLMMKQSISAYFGKFWLWTEDPLIWPNIDKQSNKTTKTRTHSNAINKQETTF
jgi:hypothetical protein